ncbi:MAG TPA: metallophosphoesterase, partial [Polyangiaceae bacterium]
MKDASPLLLAVFGLVAIGPLGCSSPESSGSSGSGGAAAAGGIAGASGNNAKGGAQAMAGTAGVSGTAGGGGIPAVDGGGGSGGGAPAGGTAGTGGSAGIGGGLAIGGSSGTGGAASSCSTGDPVFAGAGDIATNGGAQSQTADILDMLFPMSAPACAGTVFTAGDNAYSNGTLNQFNMYFDPTWGKHKARMRPTPGNHDYGTANAAGYFDYFNGVGVMTGPAGERGKGYYSYDVGAWHMIAINSNCSAIGGCNPGSPQETWLRADLTATTAKCVLAYWHHPRFSSGTNHGDAVEMQPIWQALYDSDADVVISGHDHEYERFGPQTPTGTADASRGMVEFVVGTGGAGLYTCGTLEATSIKCDNTSHGVLKLTLHPTSYDFEFIPIVGDTFTDSG